MSPVIRQKINLALLIALLVWAVLPGPRPVSAAAVLPVTTTEDQYDTGAECSLREAVVAVNTQSVFGGCDGRGASEILLPEGIFTLTQLNKDGVHEDQSATGDLDIQNDVVITGGGSGTIVHAPAGFVDRIFHVISPTNESGVVMRVINVTISNLRISGGFTAAGLGGGGVLNSKANLTLSRVLISGNSASPAVVGGGVANLSGSFLTVETSTFASNTAGFGGAIFNGGTLVVTKSLIYANTATVTGGGIYNLSGGSQNGASISNTTIAFNTSVDSYGGGAGIANSTKMSLVNSTIADNIGIGLLLNGGSETSIQNSILARHKTGPNCTAVVGAVLVSKGYNLIDQVDAAGADPCAFNGAGDLLNVDAGLSAGLGNNGGPTQTYAFANPASPAVDALPQDSPDCPALDQRLLKRPADGDGDGTARCDIGAVEANAVPAVYLYLFLPSLTRY